MPPLLPVGAFHGVSPAGPVTLFIDVVVCVVILVCLYRLQHLDERTGAGGEGGGQC